MDRVILLSDCDTFYASVETMLDPSLQGKPVAVAGDPKNRHGVVVARNQIAKGYGVRTTDTVLEAKRKCPEIVFVPPHHDRYSEVSKQVNHIYLEYTDLVEPYSVDESYLDITRITSRSGAQVADEIRARVREEIGITVSIGVSFCRCFAKLASEFNKPDGTSVILRGDVERLVWPRPVNDLLYVGRSTAQALGRLGIHTIGELAHAQPDMLVHRLGKHGLQIWRYANGLDSTPVRAWDAPREVKSIGSGFTFPRDISSEADIRSNLTAMADKVAASLRAKALKCRAVQVSIKSPTLKVIQRQQQLTEPSCLVRDISAAAFEVVSANWPQGAPIRALTVTALDLVPAEAPSGQMSVFDDLEQDSRREKRERLEAAVSGIRQRFGKGAVSYGMSQKLRDDGDNHGKF